MKLQEDYYKSLKKGEDLSEKCANSEAEIQQLRQRLAGLTTEMASLKQVTFAACLQCPSLKFSFLPAFTAHQHPPFSGAASAKGGSGN